MSVETMRPMANDNVMTPMPCSNYFQSYEPKDSSSAKC